MTTDITEMVKIEKIRLLYRGVVSWTDSVRVVHVSGSTDRCVVALHAPVI